MGPRLRILLFVLAFLTVWCRPPTCQAQYPSPQTVSVRKGRVKAFFTEIRSQINTPAPSAEPAFSAGTTFVSHASPTVPDDPGEAVQLKAPALEGTDVPLPINLATALRLADGRPLVVAAAQASAWVAEARLQRAKLLWVPELNMAAVYIRHDGNGPDFNRGVTTIFNINSTKLPIDQSVNYFYAGGNLYGVVAMTDAIFLPLAARLNLDSRRLEIQAAKNDATLTTAAAYFDVHRSRGTYAGALDVVERGRKLTARIKELSKDLVPRIEVDRSLRMLADLDQHVVSARQNWRESSADLTQVLRLDPRAVVVPIEHDHLQLTLIDPARSLDELIPIAQRNRPEIQAQLKTIQAVQVRVRQEKLRPFLPTILVTGFQTPGDMRMQVGIFGTGQGNALNNWSARDDVSAQLVWQLDGLGFGNLARVKEQRGAQSAEIAELYRLQDTIARDVTQTQARLQSAAARVLQAERTLRQALITYDGNYEGLRQTSRFENILIQVYRPQEAVKSLESLRVAYDEYFATVADYNRAQFEMFHALGYPAREITYFRSLGEVQPLDATRPAYLPPVKLGPPPATR